MNEETEFWRERKKAQQEKRASNRENSAEYLTEHGILFTSHNHGAHLIVEGKECFIDFWPGTGKWNCRSGKKGFGVRNLVEYINVELSGPEAASSPEGRARTQGYVAAAEKRRTA